MSIKHPAKKLTKIFNHKKIIHSTNDGQLIRTKRSDLTSGGLMNGAATINSLHVTP